MVAVAATNSVIFRREWSNDGRAPSSDVRALFAYGVQEPIVTIERGQHGSIARLDWFQFDNRVSWAPDGDWEPANWPGEQVFHPPWPYVDCRPTEAHHGYPYCEPKFPCEFWTDPGRCAGEPARAMPGPQNPYGINCPPAELGL